MRRCSLQRGEHPTGMLARSLTLLLLLSIAPACSPLQQGGSDPKRSPDGPFKLPFTPPQATPSPTDPPAGRACADVYAEDHLPTFELEIAPGDLADLADEQRAGLKVYHPAVFRYEGEVYPDAMVKYRGNTSVCGDKLQLAISFKQVNPEGRFHGLRRINLDHGSCGTIEERLSLTFVREELGLAAACANNARLVINGSYYGLYTNIEHLDREFLERNFDDPDGNLYEDGRREWKKTNESNPDVSDIDAFNAPGDLGNLETLADLDQALRMWAAEAVLPSCDNYYYFGRNFYVYNDPGSGFVYIPTDYDHALPFGWCADWMNMPSGERTASMVLDDPEWRRKFVDQLEATHARFRPEWFEERTQRWWLQVQEAAAADPFLAGEVDPTFDSIEAQIREREARIGSWLESGAHDTSTLP